MNSGGVASIMGGSAHRERGIKWKMKTAVRQCALAMNKNHATLTVTGKSKRKGRSSKRTKNFKELTIVARGHAVVGHTL